MPRTSPVSVLALLALLLGVVAIGGCRLEDRGAETEGGDLPTLEAGAPDRPGDEEADRFRGEAFAPLPVIDLGPPFWREGNTRAVEITARFVSPEARAALLDPESTAGQVEGVRWRLADILVSVDYRGGPTRARWQVAGPPRVIESYLAGLRDHPADRTPILDIGLLDLEPRPLPEDDA